MEMSLIMLSFQDIVMQCPLITLITLQETILYPLQQVIMEDKEWMIYMCIYQVGGCGLYYIILCGTTHGVMLYHISTDIIVNVTIIAPSFISAEAPVNFFANVTTKYGTTVWSSSSSYLILLSNLIPKSHSKSHSQFLLFYHMTLFIIPFYTFHILIYLAFIVSCIYMEISWRDTRSKVYSLY